MIVLTPLEVYNSIFNITEENNKFELYKFPESKSCGASYEKVRDEIEKDFGISDITATDLQNDLLGPTNFEENKQQVRKRMKIEQLMKIFSNLY